MSKKNLDALKLPELKQLAASLGLKTTGLRKAELAEAITLRREENRAAKKAAKNRSASEAAETLPYEAAAAPAADVPAAKAPTHTEVIAAPSDSPAAAEPASGGEEAGARLSRRSRRRGRPQAGELSAAPLDSATSQEVGARLAALGLGGAEPPSAEAVYVRSEHPGQSDHSDDDDEFGSNRRSRRRRNRERQNRRRTEGTGSRVDSDPLLHEDDVLIKVKGIVDVMDGYAFVRTTGYLPSPEDAYMSLSLVRRYGLRKGDIVTGSVREPRDGERREKFNPLIRVDTVNGGDPAAAKNRPEFAKLTPLYPQERLSLEASPTGMTGRIMDLVSPIGKGQRGLIVSPPKAGKTMTMQAIANAITANNPEVHLMVVLVDERPEEVTDFQRTVSGEVIASTFDRPADDHTTIAELALERAKRLVEMGQDVVILLDGITRLSRAYNLAAPASGRILSGGVDSAALYPPKKFFGAARNIEHGGSLTVLATALIETDSKMDNVIFEEFKGTGNMELRLRRDLADKRIFPAIDVDASGTRREELLLGREELAIIWKLRRVLSGMEDQAALEMLLKQMRKTSSNHEFLVQISRSTP
ncbi:MAG: transcription termination factor Rho [Propionibacteriaceae bacterium]|nr:transcription termination factor Rho [Propionibacteriaceae bacterium]